MRERLYSLLDLTSLNETDDAKAIDKLCEKANTPLGHVAAICIYPQFIAQVKQFLGNNSPIKIATVCNFPQGQTPLNIVLDEINAAIEKGADEIDVVMPYHDFINGNYEAVEKFVAACKKTCGQKLLKVILETGFLQKPEIIAKASQDVILAGADFIKTSTGKIPEGATLEAATLMLTSIRDLKMNRTVGFKAAGGVRTEAQAVAYLQLTDKLMGETWANPNTFRIGASQLANELLASLQPH